MADPMDTATMDRAALTSVVSNFGVSSSRYTLKVSRSFNGGRIAGWCTECVRCETVTLRSECAVESGTADGERQPK